MREIKLTEAEQKIADEQCRALPCVFWDDREGCLYDYKCYGGEPKKPTANCYSKETSSWFVVKPQC